MDILLFYKISSLVNALVATVLSFVIYFRNRKQLVNKLFSLFFAFVAIWSFAYFFWFVIRDKDLALFNFRVFLDGASIFIPILFFHATLALIDKVKKHQKLLKIGYLVFFFFGIANYFTPFFLKSFRKELFFDFWPEPGPFYHPFFAVWYFYLLTAFYILVKEVGRSTGGISEDSPSRRVQIKYILIGAIIGFVGSVPNMILWYTSYVIPFIPVTNFLVTIGMIIVAYAILRHRLFDIKLLVSEILVFAIWAITVIRMVLSDNNQELLVNGILVFLVFVAGILLLRSVSKEKEPIQKLLEETQKTLDLEWSSRDEFISKAKRLIKIMESAVDESEEINKKLKKKSK